MATVDRAEIQVEADLDEASFRRVARQANAELAKAGDDSGSGFGASFNRSFSDQLIRGAGNIATQFSRALQGGIVASPAIGVGLIAAIAAAMPVAGTLAAGAFVAAFGAGLTGLGLVFAAQSQDVRAAFSDLGTDLAAQMRTIARPLEVTLEQVAATIRRTFDVLAPDIESAFVDLTPALNVFVRELGAAFQNLGPAIQPLTDAFIGILSGVGERLPALFTAIADSLINLSASIDPDAFASLVVGILQIIPAINNMIAGLTRAQQVMQPWFQAIVDAVQQVVPALQELFAAFGGSDTAGQIFAALGFVVTATATVITTQIRLITAQVNRVRAVFTAVANVGRAEWQRLAAATRISWALIANTIRSVTNTIRAIVTNAWNTVTRITLRAWASVRGAVGRAISGVRSVVVSGWAAITGATSSAWARITGVVSRAVSRVVGIVRGMRAAVRGAISGLWDGLTSGLSSAVATISGLIDSAIAAVFRLIDAIRSIPSINLPDIPGFAHGVRNFGGGLAVVGEQGPELVALPRGSSVFSNTESRQMVATGAVGGSQVNNLTIINNGPAAGADLLRDITWSLKYAVGPGVRTV